MAKENHLYRISVILCFCIIITMSCSVRRSEPTTGPLDIENTALKNGEIQYMNYCQKCHPIGEGGLGPAININPAPGFAKRFQVRHGVGVMPSFSKDEITNEDLDDILAYIAALKKNK